MWNYISQTSRPKFLSNIEAWRSQVSLFVVAKKTHQQMLSSSASSKMFMSDVVSSFIFIFQSSRNQRSFSWSHFGISCVCCGAFEAWNEVRFLPHLYRVAQNERIVAFAFAFDFQFRFAFIIIFVWLLVNHFINRFVSFVFCF